MGNACKGRMMEEEDKSTNSNSSSNSCSHQIFPLNDKMHFKTPRIPYCAFSPTIDSMRRKIVNSSNPGGKLGDADDYLQPVLWGLYHNESRKRILTHEQLEKTMASMGWKARTPRRGWRSYCYYRHSPYGPSWVVARLPYPTFVESWTDYLDEFVADVNNACGKNCFSLQKFPGHPSGGKKRAV